MENRHWIQLKYIQDVFKVLNYVEPHHKRRVNKAMEYTAELLVEVDKQLTAAQR